MKLFVIFATVVAYTCAFPTFELLHPSPVNPDVLVAIKPEEKIILITDPKEIAKFKRETKEQFYPTVLPETNEHRIAKRDQTHVQVHTSEEITERKSHDESKQDDSENTKGVGLQKPETILLQESTSSLEKHKRDIPVPLVPKHHHPEESPKESSEIESDADKINKNLSQHKAKEFSEQQQYKRDIPVPLVPKYHHPEETPQDTTEQVNHKSISSKIPQIRPTPVQILKEAQKNAEASSNETNEFSQQQKRESQTSSITKHDFLKDENLHNEKKEVTAGNSEFPKTHKQSQLLPTDQNDKVFSSPVSIQNDQRLNIQNYDSVKSTTEHPLARPHPVPVAELFARPHDM